MIDESTSRRALDSLENALETERHNPNSHICGRFISALTAFSEHHKKFGYTSLEYPKQDLFCLSGSSLKPGQKLAKAYDETKPPVWQVRRYFATRPLRALFHAYRDSLNTTPIIDYASFDQKNRE